MGPKVWVWPKLKRWVGAVGVWPGQKSWVVLGAGGA